MNMKAYLSITQLGKIKHITTETLRHYDRIGLFTPGYIDSDTRYRYYSLDQIEQIDTILELRDMGMSLGLFSSSSSFDITVLSAYPSGTQPDPPYRLLRFSLSCGISMVLDEYQESQVLA